MPGDRLRSARLAIALAVVIGLGACARVRAPVPRLPPLPMPTPVSRPVARSVESIVAELGPRVRARWQPYVAAAGLPYPPPELALLAFKRERRLEIWGRADGAPPAGSRWSRIDALPILAASGVAGPKLRRGDRQVPEGMYRLVAFNPNSSFHLSMKLDYPNADDLAIAAEDGRTDLGGDIFIHGDALSTGCLALGDRAIEDLFVLVADVGLEHVHVIVAPHDPRGPIGLAPIPGLAFTTDLYRRIEAALQAF